MHDNWESRRAWVQSLDLNTKISTLYVAQFFMKFLKLAFIYKNHDTLCYVTFFDTKSQTLRKKQDTLRYFFIYKNPDTLRYGVFKKFLKLAFIYKKHDTLRYLTFLYTQIQTLGKKQDTLCYVFTSLSCIVRTPLYWGNYTYFWKRVTTSLKSFWELYKPQKRIRKAKIGHKWPTCWYNKFINIFTSLNTSTYGKKHHISLVDTVK